MKGDHYDQAGEGRAAQAFYQAVLARAPPSNNLPPSVRDAVRRAAAQVEKYKRDFENHLVARVVQAGFDPLGRLPELTLPCPLSRRLGPARPCLPKTAKAKPCPPRLEVTPRRLEVTTIETDSGKRGSKKTGPTAHDRCTPRRLSSLGHHVPGKAENDDPIPDGKRLLPLASGSGRRYIGGDQCRTRPPECRCVYGRPAARAAYANAGLTRAFIVTLETNARRHGGRILTDFASRPYKGTSHRVNSWQRSSFCKILSLRELRFILRLKSANE